jgi:hypothetical protein
MGIFLSFDPVQQFLLQEPPQLSLAFAEGMRGDISKTCPRDEGAGVHLENLCRRFSIEELICHWLGSVTDVVNGCYLRLPASNVSREERDARRA